MPHDKTGLLISVGDKVVISAVVTSITTGEEYCNVTLATIEPMYPGNQPTTIVLNAKQMVKIEPVEFAGGVPVESEVS